MKIIVETEKGTVAFVDEANYLIFRDLIASGEKIRAIKLIREKMPYWGLLECKLFVEACYFPPMPCNTDTGYASPRSVDVKSLLGDICDDVRGILVEKSDYRESMIVDLFSRVSRLHGKYSN